MSDALASQGISMGRFTACVLLVTVLAGCGGPADEWPRAAAGGRVTLDGQPLKTGTITFFPAGATRGPAAGAEIVDGEYAIPAAEGPVVGMNRIEIRSVQKTGRMVESPTAVESDGPYVEGLLVEEHADVVPRRYNTYSELERDVRPDTNEFSFELTSEPAADRG
jgi:hypothetical protein